MAIGRIPEPLAGIQEAILDAKGDLISATAADTPARLAVGSNNQILMADSAQSTGLKWAASATSTLTAKGDLLTATAANTIARLGVGADGTTLVADSTQSTGLKWAAAASPSYTWTSFTPTWSNLTVGNGTLGYAKYLNIGNIVFYKLSFTFGSTTSVSGNVSMSVPYGTQANANMWSGQTLYYDSSAGATYVGGAIQTDQQSLYFRYGVNNIGTNTYMDGGNNIAATTPFTWTTSDRIQAVGWYEIS